MTKYPLAWPEGWRRTPAAQRRASGQGRHGRRIPRGPGCVGAGAEGVSAMRFDLMNVEDMLDRCSDGCACQSSDARRCIEFRCGHDEVDPDERCECSCHETDDDDAPE